MTLPFKTLPGLGGAGTYSYSRSNCTHERLAQSVFAVGKRGELWAGALKELEECSGWDLIVSAVGFGSFENNPVKATEKARALLGPELFDWEPPAVVGLSWPDRGVPNLGRAWWKSLAGEIKALNGKVGVCCMGGHGRTGTMLSILVPLLGGVKGKKKCPVTWVRKNYCKEAVESDAQLDYVEYITERVVHVDASDDDKSYVAPKPLGGGTDQVNPTVGLPGTEWGPSTITQIGSTDGEGVLTNASDDGGVIERFDDPRDPTDLELLYAWETGDGKLTAPIEGTSRRWTANFDEKDEIVGWTEEAEAEALPPKSEPPSILGC